jgi:hypothetical protein
MIPGLSVRTFTGQQVKYSDYLGDLITAEASCEDSDVRVFDERPAAAAGMTRGK